jgi:hypothetical protein
MKTTATTSYSECATSPDISRDEYDALVKRVAFDCESSVFHRVQFRFVDRQMVAPLIGMEIQVFMAELTVSPCFARLSAILDLETSNCVADVLVCFGLSSTLSAEKAAELYREFEAELVSFISVEPDSVRRWSVTNPSKCLIDAHTRGFPSATYRYLWSISRFYPEHGDKSVPSYR